MTLSHGSIHGCNLPKGSRAGRVLMRLMLRCQSFEGSQAQLFRYQRCCRAAYRIHHAIRDSGIDSKMLVNVAASGDWTVQGPTSKWAKTLVALG